ncbi:MAG: hypothetical protein KAR42_05565 [candidate division Zixibacteria bacterium]|nr:hypothetical protein [candidate division Zixibacteria bacterium]
MTLENDSSEKYQPEISQGVNQPLCTAFRAELEHLKLADGIERADFYERAEELGMRIIKGEV